MILRKAYVGDRKAIEDILITCGAFGDEEIQIGLEVFDAAAEGEYDAFVAEVDGVPRSYICVSLIPMTRSTWHVYWIATHGGYCGQGLGTALQNSAEAFIRKAGGERITLETSGRADYLRTRRFYETVGYSAVGRIPDFYKPGDDCVIYWKDLR